MKEDGLQMKRQRWSDLQHQEDGDGSRNAAFCCAS
jgi:hypothetical protein